jgi:hypothetical protein
LKSTRIPCFTAAGIHSRWQFEGFEKRLEEITSEERRQAVQSVRLQMVTTDWRRPLLNTGNGMRVQEALKAKAEKRQSLARHKSAQAVALDRGPEALDWELSNLVAGGWSFHKPLKCFCLFLFAVYTSASVMHP